MIDTIVNRTADGLVIQLFIDRAFMSDAASVVGKLARSSNPLVSAALANGATKGDQDITLVLPDDSETIKLILAELSRVAAATSGSPTLESAMAKDIAHAVAKAANLPAPLRPLGRQADAQSHELSGLAVPHPVVRQLAVKPDAGFEPDLTSYDTVIVTFSGGKDSLASLLRTLELATRQGRDLVRDQAVELWHEDVDSPESGHFMDWPITTAYVKAVGEAFGIPVFLQWKVGGFLGELTKEQERTAPTKWEEPGGRVETSGGEAGDIGTRLKFPQTSPDLRVRWCSSVLKIDPCCMAIRNQDRFKGRRTLVVSGERAEESPGRARYKVFEPDRTHLKSGARHVDRWRPVHHWTTAQVWESIRAAGVVAHPAYRAGLGRVSCAFCIFASRDQLATVRQIMPEAFRRIVDLEKSFGVTIKRDKRSFDEWADRGTPYPVRDVDVAEGRRLAVLTTYDAPILVRPEDWILPLGAFADGSGPT